MIKNYKQFINESYSSDKDEILEFIDELPEKIILYRSLIIPKDDDVINT